MQPVKRIQPEWTREGAATRSLAEAIAQDLWKRYGGSERLNWAGVERHLRRLVEQARIDVRKSRPVLVSVIAAAHPMRVIARRRRA